MAREALIACIGEGFVALGPGASPLLSQAEYEACRPLATAEYSFVALDGGDVKVLAISGPAAPPPRPAGMAFPAIEFTLPSGLRAVSLRELYATLPHAELTLACRAVHLRLWRSRSLYCPRCAHDLSFDSDLGAMRCPACGLQEFPRLSPAVIVRVELGDRIALAHNSGFGSGLHSLIAGFVEAGESLEEACAREVLEEIGVRIGGPRYFASQAWPFPSSIMLGFCAQALDSELRPDGREILSAQWFSRDKLPPLPRPGSIARAMIDDWIAGP